MTTNLKEKQFDNSAGGENLPVLSWRLLPVYENPLHEIHLQGFNDHLILTPNMKYAIILDLDRTIALPKCRDIFLAVEPRNFRASEKLVHLDEVNEPVFSWIMCLINEITTANSHLCVVTAREGTDICSQNTMRWLEKHLKHQSYSLYMRKVGDNRRSHEVKYDILQEISMHRKIFCAFEDQDNIVDMMWKFPIPHIFQVKGKEIFKVVENEKEDLVELMDQY